MNRPLALIFALHSEAAPLITALDLKRSAHDAMHLYGKEGILLIISGVGSDRGKEAARACIREFSPFIIINAGSAGALGSLAKGDIVEIASVTSDSADIGNLSLTNTNNTEAFPGTRLISVHDPSINDLARSRLSLVADCVDMEGYAIADECAHHNTECRIIKIITDTIGDTSIRKIKRSIHELSASLCQSMIPVIMEYMGKQ